MADKDRMPSVIRAFVPALVAFSLMTLAGSASAEETRAEEGEDLVFEMTLPQADAITRYKYSYSTEGRTAHAYSDFLPISGDVTYEPGQLTKYISVRTYDDCSQNEPDETMVLVLKKKKTVRVLPGGGEIIVTWVSSNDPPNTLQAEGVIEDDGWLPSHCLRRGE